MEHISIPTEGSLELTINDISQYGLKALFPRYDCTAHLLKNEYSVADLFEMGQCSYELALSQFMFVTSTGPKDCLLFFICQADGLSASHIIDYDFNAAEPSVSLVLDNYDFVLTCTCSSADLQARKAIIYTTVSDIPEEIKDKIFAPLFTTKSKGQGFGLAVCKRVIEAQGGTINFESEVGKGTIFTIELPIAQKLNRPC
jgi:hypothetical protein